MGKELPHPEASLGSSRIVCRAGRAPAAGDAGGTGVRASAGDFRKRMAKPSVLGATERVAAAQSPQCRRLSAHRALPLSGCAFLLGV